MVRTRVNSRGVRSNKSTSDNRIGRKPDSFINIPQCQKPPHILSIEDLEEFQTTFNNFRNVLAEHVVWLTEQRDSVVDTLRQNGKRVAISRNNKFRLLNSIVPNEVKMELTSPARTGRKTNQTNSHMDNPNITEPTVAQNEDRTVNHENAEKPVHPVIPESQIKVEAMTPTVMSPVPRPVFNPTSINVAPPSSRTFANVRDIAKQEKMIPSEMDSVSTPRRLETRQTRATTRNAHYLKAPIPEKTDAKILDFENKMKAAQERKEKQEQRKVEKAKKEREEKAQKVQKNLELQRAEAEKKLEDKRKREAAEEEIRRLNKSPARTRVASSAVNTPMRATGTSPARNTPTRFNPASPSRAFVPRTPGFARVQLFGNQTSTPRTPGRRPTKQSRIEELHAQEEAAATPFESPIRELPRKVPTFAKGDIDKKEIKGEADIKKEKLSPVKTQQTGKIHDDFKNEQLRLLLGDADNVEQLSKQAELENSRKEQERKDAERLALEEAHRREEARRKEEAEIRRREEARRKEEARQAEALRIEKMRQLEEQRRAEEHRKAEEKKKREMEEERRKEEEERNAEHLKNEKPINKLLNTTMDIEDSELDNSSYEMTQEKIYIPSTAENYNIEDLSSGDETDDEGAPRKQVPTWAGWTALYRTATDQYKDHNRSYEAMFGTMDNPHNQPIFNQNKTKKRPRGSSAHWNSPVSNPTKGRSRFLGY